MKHLCDFHFQRIVDPQGLYQRCEAREEEEEAKKEGREGGRDSSIRKD